MPVMSTWYQTYSPSLLGYGSNYNQFSGLSKQIKKVKFQSKGSKPTQCFWDNFRAGENETEIDFVLVGKGNRKFLRDVKVIPGGLQHRLVVTDLVKKKVVRKKAIEIRKVWKLKEDDTRARFEGRVGKLVCTGLVEMF